VKMYYFGSLSEKARQRRSPRKTRKEVADKDRNDLHIKPSEAVDCSK